MRSWLNCNLTSLLESFVAGQIWIPYKGFFRQTSRLKICTITGSICLEYRCFVSTVFVDKLYQWNTGKFKNLYHCKLFSP